MHLGLYCMYWGKWQWVLQSHSKLVCLGSGSNILKQETKVCTYVRTYVRMCAAIADGRDISIITKRDTFWTLIVWLAVRNKMCIAQLVSFFVNMFGHTASSQEDRPASIFRELMFQRKYLPPPRRILLPWTDPTATASKNVRNACHVTLIHLRK